LDSNNSAVQIVDKGAYGLLPLSIGK
jgi:hypothetical protein